MYFPEKTKITAPGRKNRHTYSHFHETTSGFMMPNVPFIKRIIPNSKIEFNYDAYVRLDGMPKATMGQASVHYNWFYVPMRIIWRPWNNFISQSLNHTENGASYLSKVPTFVIRDILKVLTDNQEYAYMVIGEDDPFDFVYKNGKYKLNVKGIQAMTILQQLGYNFWDSSKQVSALPLLAFAKIILDYYVPKEWQDYELSYNTIYNYFNNNSTYTIDIEDLKTFFKLFYYVFLDDDYFTAAWQHMNGPNGNSVAPISITLPNNEGTIYQRVGTANTPQVSNDAVLVKTGNVFSQYDLNMLKAMDEYLKSNQIIGTKYWDRLLKMYGVAPAKALITVPEKIESRKTPIIFNQVFATAETIDGANLGDYAGKGEASIDEVFSFKYESEEEGYLMCIVTIVPDVAYGNGIDREALSTEPLDYYNAPYDGMGGEPIYSAEIYTGYDGNENQQNSVTDQVWGFLPRYAWLKNMYNKCTGKMAFNSLKNEMGKWNFMRYFDKGSFILTAKELTIYNSLAFSLGTYDNGWDGTGYNYGTQYDRIFYSPQNHNFNIYMLFNWTQWNTMKALFAYDGIADKDEGEKLITTSIDNSIN